MERYNQDRNSRLRREFHLNRSDSEYQRHKQRLRQWAKDCQPWTCPVNYPPKNCVAPQIDSNPFNECTAVGYTPKQPNPGGLKFYIYDYPYPRPNGELPKHTSRGWNVYNTTGRFPTRDWWG